MNYQNSFVQNLIVPFLLCVLMLSSFLIFKYNPELMNQESYLSVLTKNADNVDKWVHLNPAASASSPPLEEQTKPGAPTSPPSRVPHNFVEIPMDYYTPPVFSAEEPDWSINQQSFAVRDTQNLSVYNLDGLPEQNFSIPKAEQFSPGLLMQSGRHYFLSTLNGQTFAFDSKSGLVTWYRAAYKKIFFAPQVLGQHVVVFSEDKSGKTWGLQVLAAENGEIIQALSGLEMPLAGEPLVNSNRVYYATQNGRLRVASLETGETIWSAEGSSGFRTAPVIVGERTYITNEDGLLLGFDRVGGRKVSEFDLETTMDGNLVHSEGSPYATFVDTQGNLVAVDLRSSKRIWKYQLNMRPPTTPGALQLLKLTNGSWNKLGVASALGGWTAWTYCNGSRLCIYDLKNGLLLHRIELKGKPLGAFQFITVSAENGNSGTSGGATALRLFVPLERSGKRLMAGFEIPESSVDKSKPGP